MRLLAASSVGRNNGRWINGMVWQGQLTSCLVSFVGAVAEMDSAVGDCRFDTNNLLDLAPKTGL